MADKAVLNKFPKVRERLPEAYQSIYKQHYQENRGGKTAASSVAQKMEAWLHHQVARDVIEKGPELTTLEIGAGNLNQLQYEPASDHYDIIEPFGELYANSPYLPRVKEIFQDVSEVPADRRYDRLTSIATFEHITNLPEVVARSALLLKEGGSLRVSIPSEGTLLWTLGWKFTTGIEFKHRFGLDYGVIMRNEHVNTAKEIENVIHCFYTQVRPRFFGISAGLSFYQFFEGRNPDVAACERYLASLAT